MRPVFLFAIYAVAFAGVTIFRASADANNPAHDLAQKFAIGDQPKPAAVFEAPPVAKPEIKAQPELQPKIVAKPPVAPAVAKPVAKPAPAKTEIQAQAPAAAPAPKAPVAAAAPVAKPRPPAPGPDYEKDMLEAARAEAQARETLQTQQAESQPATVTAPEPAPPAVAPPSSPPPSAQATTPQVATPQVAPPVPPQAAPQVEPQAAAPQPAAAPAHAASPQIKIEAKVNIPAPAAAAIVSRPEGAPRATILAVLTHHAHDAGRPITPPDPIICLADICYISAGPNADAKLISRSEALSTKNTVTSGAGACKGMSRCAYRGVSMKRGDEVQIIDLGLVGHDKREPADVTPDTSCRVDEGDLVCDQPVAAPDYRIWVVPETVAAAAGPGAIEHALADDLPEEDFAQAGDK